eukprot:3318788-Rhodomonas_salina.2
MVAVQNVYGVSEGWCGGDLAVEVLDEGPPCAEHEAARYLRDFLHVSEVARLLQARPHRAVSVERRGGVSVSGKRQRSRERERQKRKKEREPEREREREKDRAIHVPIAPYAPLST